MKNFKTYFLFLAALLVFVSCLFAGENTVNPGEFIIKTLDEGLEILKDPAFKKPETFQERNQKLWELLEPVFDFELLSKRALGMHWKERTEEERQQFVKLFTDMLKRIYLSKTSSYTGEKFVYIREFIRNNYSKVQTNVITKENKKIAVDFNLYKLDNKWKIYDVIIEGVSIVSNYRSQFESILSNSTFKQLLEKMKEKDPKQQEEDIVSISK